MAYNTGAYPISGKFYLDPTAYNNTSGTDIGFVESGMLVSVDKSLEIFGADKFGTVPRNARITGANAVFAFNVHDYSQVLLDWIWAGLQGTHQVSQYFTSGSYRPGHVLPDTAYKALIIRPQTDALANNVDKPWLYIKRSLVVSAGLLAWNRTIDHVAPMQIQVMAMGHDPVKLPFYYGNISSWPSI